MFFTDTNLTESKQEKNGNPPEDLVQSEWLKALGTSPNETDTDQIPVAPVIADRWAFISKNGLKQPDLELLLLFFDPPAFLPVPKLNKEVEWQIHEGAKERDKFLVEQQRLTQMSLGNLAGLVTGFMDPDLEIEEKFRVGMIATASDAVQLQTQLFYEQSQTRKAYILPLIKNQAIKDLLCEQITDDFLFGKDLPQKISDLEKVRKVVKQMGPETENRLFKGARAFLERRAAHPNRVNKPWSGQGALTGRWNFQGKVPKFGQQSQNPKQHYRNMTQNKKK